ncbi:PH domain-containing protein [Polymorphospora sp. NPDC050346]|uniref:PH domain-containing protein n=1 Tax=Polymorphospora sp. NPDC050346 TaxID=3155780 RepID=UPI0033D4A856
MTDVNRTLRLRPPRNPVERRAIGWWAVQAVVVSIPVLAPLVVVGLLVRPARQWLLLAAALIGVVTLFYALVVPWIRYRVHRWEVTKDAVYTRRGWFLQQWRIAPISRIQTVDTVRGPIEQGFALSTVTVTTASAKGAIKIEGLDRESAETLAHQLTEVTQATPGDAT